MSHTFKNVLVTGGAGYIGSHCVVDLLENGYTVIAIDNFANAVGDEQGSAALKRVEQITGKTVTFYKCDLLDKAKLKSIFDEHDIGCVVHFAALKAVGESMQQPLMYYQNNLLGMLNLLEGSVPHKGKKEPLKDHFVVASVCVSIACGLFLRNGLRYQVDINIEYQGYERAQLLPISIFELVHRIREPDTLPITETHPTGNITNVYGRTKYFIEEMLKDLSRADKTWNIIALRYFNPVGAHQSGLIGEDPTKAFTNLMPFMAQVALGKHPALTVFGNDYSTPDGTGVRDYIHVMDLASGHVAALEMLSKSQVGLKVYNLGTGKGVSVKELVDVFERVTGAKVPLKFESRRLGDITAMWADASLAKKELNWSTKLTIEEMCSDFWRWQTMNPDGYPKSKQPNESAITNGNGI